MEKTEVDSKNDEKELLQQDIERIQSFHIHSYFLLAFSIIDTIVCCLSNSKYLFLLNICVYFFICGYWLWLLIPYILFRILITMACIIPVYDVIFNFHQNGFQWQIVAVACSLLILNIVYTSYVCNVYKQFSKINKQFSKKDLRRQLHRLSLFS